MKKRDSTSKNFAVGIVQMKCSEHPDDNLRKAEQLVAQAAKRGAKIVCLPELFRTPYFCQREDASHFDLAEPVPGPTTKAIAKTAKKFKVAIVTPVFEKRGAGIYHNSAAIIDADGSLIGLYRKMHIPDDPGYFEKYYFTPGDLGFRAFDTRYGRIAPLICWDQWYPEAARLSSLLGSSVLLYPTAIGWHPHEKKRYGAAQREAWKTVQRGHAIANGIYVAVANRIGHEKPNPQSTGIEFWGSSFIADPQGVIVAEASADKEEVLVANVDLNHLEDVRRNWPFLRDRRIDAYHGITDRYLTKECWKP